MTEIDRLKSELVAAKLENVRNRIALLKLEEAALAAEVLVPMKFAPLAAKPAKVAAPKKKGGWPKGKPRGKKVKDSIPFPTGNETSEAAQ